MAFQVFALESGQFDRYFAMTPAQLAAEGCRLLVADDKPGYPCRVSLADAEVGEEVLLLPYAHHDVAAPYRASGPIFVRRGAVTAEPAPGEVPEMLLHRALSLRSYDAEGMMRAASVVQGTELARALESALEDPTVRVVHVHNAGPGCFNCRVERV